MSIKNTVLAVLLAGIGLSGCATMKSPYRMSPSMGKGPEQISPLEWRGEIPVRWEKK